MPLQSSNKEKIMGAVIKGYYVDKDGNVYSPNKKLNPNTSNGYLEFGYRNKNNKIIKLKVHRLQAYQKYGEKVFEDGIVVRHLNGNRLDASYDNIAIGTCHDNNMDIPEEKRKEYAINATKHMIKHDFIKIREFYNKCKSYKETMKHFNISSKGTLHYILNNRYINKD